MKLELPLPAPPVEFRARTPGAVVDRPLDGNEWFFGDWLTWRHGDRRLLLVSDGASAYDVTPERLRVTLLRCAPHSQHDPAVHPEDSPAPFLDEGYQEARFWLAAPTADATTATLDQLATGLLTPAEHLLDNAHPSSP